MPMFKKNLKLIATAVGLVTVLVMGLATLGVTQQPENPWARSNVIKMLETQFARLTAAEGEPILNVAGAIMWSDPARLMAFVPPLSASLPIDKLRAIAAGEEIAVTIGGLYVGEDRREGGMRPGVYRIRLVGKSKVVLVDEEGNEAYAGRVTHFEELTEPSTNIVLAVKCTGECLDAGGVPPAPQPPSPPPPPPPPPSGSNWSFCFQAGVNLKFFSIGFEIHKGG
jgi:hypothetical protein